MRRRRSRSGLEWIAKTPPSSEQYFGVGGPGQNYGSNICKASFAIGATGAIGGAGASVALALLGAEESGGLSLFVLFRPLEALSEATQPIRQEHARTEGST